MTEIAPLTERPAWRALQAHHAELAPRHLRELFAEDPGRGERLTAEALGLYLDYSKHRITDETAAPAACSWPRSRGLRERTDAMFRGERINVSEHRSVLHVALRMPRAARRWSSTGSTWWPRCTRCSTAWPRSRSAVRSGEWTGLHRPADPQRRQHRHRRLGSRAGDGLRGAARTTPSAS